MVEALRAPDKRSGFSDEEQMRWSRVSGGVAPLALRDTQSNIPIWEEMSVAYPTTSNVAGPLNGAPAIDATPRLNSSLWQRSRRSSTGSDPPMQASTRFTGEAPPVGYRELNRGSFRDTTDMADDAMLRMLNGLRRL